jgi:hypothetical protein
MAQHIGSQAPPTSMEGATESERATIGSFFALSPLTSWLCVSSIVPTFTRIEEVRHEKASSRVRADSERGVRGAHQPWEAGHRGRDCLRARVSRPRSSRGAQSCRAHASRARRAPTHQPVTRFSSRARQGESRRTVRGIGPQGVQVTEQLGPQAGSPWARFPAKRRPVWRENHHGAGWSGKRPLRKGTQRIRGQDRQRPRNKRSQRRKEVTTHPVVSYTAARSEQSRKRVDPFEERCTRGVERHESHAVE